MKFKSKKLTALAMAVLMAASTMSPTALAEEVAPATEAAPATEVVVESVEGTEAVDKTAEEASDNEEAEATAPTPAGDEDAEYVVSDVMPIVEEFDDVLPITVDVPMVIAEGGAQEELPTSIHFFYDWATKKACVVWLDVPVDFEPDGSIPEWPDWWMPYAKQDSAGEYISIDADEAEAAIKDLDEGIVFHYSESVTAKESESNCTTPRKVELSTSVVKVNNKDAKTTLTQGVADGHDIDYTVNYWLYNPLPTHTDEGRKWYAHKCKKCGELIPTAGEENYKAGIGEEGEDYEIVPAQGHEYDETKVDKYIEDPNGNVEFKDGKPVFDENGKAVLKDKAKNGFYYEVHYCTAGCKHDGVCYDENKGEYSEWRHRVDVWSKAGLKYTITTADSVNIDWNLTAPKWQNAQVGVSSIATDKLPTDDQIVLYDCSKKGTYYVQFVNESGDLVKYEQTVAAHHTKGAVVYESDDKNFTAQCEVGRNGKLINKQCNKTVDYYEVYHCISRDCPLVEKPSETCPAADTQMLLSSYTSSFGIYRAADKKHKPVVEKVKKQLDASNAMHTINPDTQANIERHINANKTSTKIEFDYPRYDWIVEYIENAKDYPDEALEDIEIISNTSTCTAPGEVTLGYTCVVCGAKNVKTVTVSVDANGHKKGLPVEKDRTEPTCESMGSMFRVEPCVHDGCDYEFSRREVSIPRLPHTNEDPNHYTELLDGNVDYYDLINTVDDTATLELVGDIVVGNESNSGSEIKHTIGAPSGALIPYLGYYGNKELQVRAELTTTCKNCRGNKINVCEYKNGSLVNPVIEYTNLVRQDAECMPGSITISASAVKKVDGEDVTITAGPITCDYYSTIHAYQSQTAHKFGEPVVEIIEPATADKAGKKRTTKKCEVCGYVSVTEETIPPTGVTVLPAVAEVKAEKAGQGQVTVTWSKVEGAEGYFIFAKNRNHNGELAGYVVGGDVTTWTDKNAKTDTYSLYWVTAYNKDANGNTVQGENNKAVYDYAIAIEPGTVSGVKATSVDGGVSLSWNAAKNANSYLVLAKDGGKGEYVVKDVAYGTSYTDDTATTANARYYWVIATYEGANGNRLAAGAASKWVAARAK